MDPTLVKTKLNVLDKRIHAFLQGYRQNIAMLGDEDETTYLLDNYLNSKPAGLIYLRINTVHTDRKSFTKGVILSLLSEYAGKNSSLDDLINITEPLLKYCNDAIKNILKKNGAPSFLETLEIINKFVNESGKRCVFIIEDFLELRKLFPNFHQDFSKFIILQNNCMIILTGPNSKESQKILHCDLNFLFGNFEKIVLEESNFIDSYLHLKNSLDSKYVYSPFFISFFVNILGSNSFYQKLMKPLIEKMYNCENPETTIISIIKEALFNKEAYFFQKFMKKINYIEDTFKDNQLVLRILLAISEGYIRQGELLSLGIYNRKNLCARLQKLSELNYIENLGNVYRIRDPFLSFWLSHVFKFLFMPPISDPLKRSVYFAECVKETISLFKEDFFKDKIRKVMELISSFKDDILKLGKDKYRLPTIDKSRLISYPEKKMHLLIGEGKEIIFAAIKEDGIEDNDVFDFIEKGSSIKGKNVRKILISLDTFTSTARLAAKNNRIIAWDLNEINGLFRVYNKPVISFENSAADITTSENISNF
jgi:hypothetical protein